MPAIFSFDLNLSLREQKKFLDIELLFAEEAADFRTTDEFDLMVAELDLPDYWQRYQPPDEG